MKSLVQTLLLFLTFPGVSITISKRHQEMMAVISVSLPECTKCNRHGLYIMFPVESLGSNPVTKGVNTQ